MSEQQTPANQAANNNGQDDVTHFGFRNVPKARRLARWPKYSTAWRVNTTS